MATASPKNLSRNSAKDIQEATRQVYAISRCDDGQQEWPKQLLAAALARDGEELVINHLANLAAGAAIAVARESGQDPREAIHWVVVRMEPLSSGIGPFSGLAWKRAIDCVFHLLGDQLRIPGCESITAVDLAGALLLLQALGVYAALGWRKDPQRMHNGVSTSPPGPRAPRQQHKALPRTPPPANETRDQRKGKERDEPSRADAPALPERPMAQSSHSSDPDPGCASRSPRSATASTPSVTPRTRTSPCSHSAREH